MSPALLLALVLTTSPPPAWDHPKPASIPHKREGMRQQDVSSHFCNWIRVDDPGEGPMPSQASAVRLHIHEAWLTSTPGQEVPGSRLEGRVLDIGPAAAGAGVRTMLTGLRHGAELRVAIREEVGHPLTKLWQQVPREAQIHLRVRVEVLDGK